MACVFCEIISRQLPSFIIAEDEDTIVFVARDGHPIVATKKHIPDVFGLSDELASAIMVMARDNARATKDGLAADGIYITQTNGSAAGQSVFHYHMHIYPKWSDGRQLHRDDHARKRTMERVRASLQKQASSG